MSNEITRREFVAGAVATGATLFLPTARVLGANDRINIAIIGCGGRGGAHINAFNKIEGVRVAAISDPDLKRMEAGAEKLAAPVTRHQDFRRILDDKSIDAVVIATPNHWHAPMTIMACRAGKHVYVEKPVSHGIWEGRKMVEAARANNRIVQAGTQHRSDPYLNELSADLKAGKYGKVLWIHCSKLGARKPIGKVSAATKLPDHIDYNLWAGPAPMTPVMRKSFHYDWHWQWNWGNGEMGNWGIHYIDDVLNILDLSTVPNSVIAAGNRFAWDDDGQTPNMHMALFDYQGMPLVIDIRNLPDPKRPQGKRAGGNGGAVYRQTRQGNFIMCESAVIRVARGGGKSYDKDSNETIKQYKGTGGSGHDVNFIKAVRSGKRCDLNAEIEVSHRSAILCHQANISYRMGEQASADQITESVSRHPDAVDTLRDMLEQVHGNGVDLKSTPFMLGPKLTFDPQRERFTGSHAEVANGFVRREYRAPFARELEA
ncbi:MAG: Gfo/Idh/MocA family oxidoreductase [Planctomycetes bacterium]|nr:Gfo/Idh/MocA family oxidoreductase [Planctomycetota bacterium]